MSHLLDKSFLHRDESGPVPAIIYKFKVCFDGNITEVVYSLQITCHVDHHWKERSRAHVGSWQLAGAHQGSCFYTFSELDVLRTLMTTEAMSLQGEEEAQPYVGLTQAAILL